jgi:hypothetical protein
MNALDNSYSSPANTGEMTRENPSTAVGAFRGITNTCKMQSIQKMK